MAVTLEVEIDDDVVREALVQMVDAGQDMTVLMDRIGRKVKDQTQRRFETETDPEGSVWPASLRALATNGETLTKTGNLRQSITYKADRDSALIGTDVIYAAIHQFGGTIEREAGTQTIHRKIDGRTGKLGNRFVKARDSNFASDHAVGAYTITMPRRAFLGLDDADQTEIRTLCLDYFDEIAL